MFEYVLIRDDRRRLYLLEKTVGECLFTREFEFTYATVSRIVKKLPPPSVTPWILVFEAIWHMQFFQQIFRYSRYGHV